MPIITNDHIRDISVKTVEGFINDKVPLSAGLAKQAAALDLNSEQIKRAVEATNSIAYLKILNMVDDRTVEFDLCKEAEVMQHIVLPDGMTSISDIPAVIALPTTSIEKVASVVEINPTVAAYSKMSEHELKLNFIKEAAINDARVAFLEDSSLVLMSQINSLVNEIRADQNGLDKLASYTEGEAYAELSTIVYGSVKDNAATGLYKVAELQRKEDRAAIDKLGVLVKEAKDLNEELTKRKGLQVEAELIKKAFLGAIGSAIGRGIGGAIAGTARAIGSATARSASNVGAKVADKARTIVGKAPLNLTPKKLGLGAGLATAGSIALDASLYKPGNNPDTGRSKDVWTALQKQ